MPAKFSTTNDVFFKIYQQKQWRANEALEWMANLSNQHVILEKQKGALQFEKKERCHRVYFSNGVYLSHFAFTFAKSMGKYFWAKSMPDMNSIIPYALKNFSSFAC